MKLWVMKRSWALSSSWRTFLPAELVAVSPPCGWPTPTLSGENGIRAMPLP